MRTLSPEVQDKFDAFCIKRNCEQNVKTYDVFASRERRLKVREQGKKEMSKAIETLRAEYGTHDVERIFKALINHKNK